MMWIFRSSSASPRILSIMRVVLAFSFFSVGTMKMFGYPSRGGAPVVFDPFTQIGLAAIIEVVGGALLMLGLGTRPAAFIMSGEMAVAYFQNYASKSFFPVINGGQAPALFCWIWFYFSFVGGGPWSLDALIASRQKRQGTGNEGGLRT